MNEENTLTQTEQADRLERETEEYYERKELKED